jgi:hypothetical protein
MKKDKVLKPKVGDYVYIDPGHDRYGGRAKITSVESGMSAGEKVLFVGFAGITCMKFNWEILFKEQEKLKKLYGDEMAKPDPSPDNDFDDDDDEIV